LNKRWWWTASVAAALVFSPACDRGTADDGRAGAASAKPGPASKGKGPDRPEGQADPAVPVVVISAVRADMEAFLEASSTLEAERSVEVVSQATGVVAQYYFEEGGRVARGQVLARLAYEDLELAETRARSELERLRADFARAERLSAEQLIPDADFQKVQFDLARADVDWQKARLELERTRIVAPIAGIVTARMINVGQLIRSNDPVYRIVDFDSLVAPVFAPERYLQDIAVGQEAILTTPALGGAKVAGRVERISPVVDTQSGTIRVVVRMAPDVRLRPGMFANVQLVLDRHESVVVVPKKALVFEDETPHVFVIEDGAARRRAVSLGYQDDARAEVAEGVAEGDSVVLVGQSTLKDGTVVVAEDEAGRKVGGEPATAGSAPAGAAPAGAGS